jgi:hypothetical protein
VSQDPAERAVQKDKGWRSASADWIARAHSLIAHLDDEYAQGRNPTPLVISPQGKDPFKASDVVRRLLHLLDSLQHNIKAEERAAWDQYYAACRLARPMTPTEELAREATRMLEERRKVFERPVEDPKGGTTR